MDGNLGINDQALVHIQLGHHDITMKSELCTNQVSFLDFVDEAETITIEEWSIPTTIVLEMSFHGHKVFNPGARVYVFAESYAT